MNTLSTLFKKKNLLIGNDEIFDSLEYFELRNRLRRATLLLNKKHHELCHDSQIHKVKMTQLINDICIELGLKTNYYVLIEFMYAASTGYRTTKNCFGLKYHQKTDMRIIEDVFYTDIERRICAIKLDRLGYQSKKTEILELAYSNSAN